MNMDVSYVFKTKMVDSSIFKTNMDDSSIFPRHYNHEFIHVGPNVDLSSVFKTKMDGPSIFKAKMDDSSIFKTKIDDSSLLVTGPDIRRLRPRRLGLQAELKPSVPRAPGGIKATLSQHPRPGIPRQTSDLPILCSAPLCATNIPNSYASRCPPHEFQKARANDDRRFGV